MAQVNQNFQMWEKDTVILQVTITDNSNSPVDLTGVSLTWVLFRGTASFANKSIGNGIAITEAVSGIFQITLAPADTVGLTGLFTHECYLTDSYGNQTTVMTGTATITPSSPFK